MKIEKTIDEKGKITILVDGKAPNYELSRILTGTTNENQDGIFVTRNYEVFRFGDFSNTIYFSHSLGLTTPNEDYAEELAARIQKVRAWVQKCRDTAGTVEIEDLPEVAQELSKEKRLYYRNSKGQIKPLD